MIPHLRECPFHLQYEHHMVLELIKMGHETSEQKACSLLLFRASFYFRPFLQDMAEALMCHASIHEPSLAGKLAAHRSAHGCI